MTNGRSATKGINAQTWAAMSLFIQYVSHSDFEYVGFEHDKLRDFHLVFEDGHKVICENKATTLNYSQIRDILSGFIRDSQSNPEDDLLLICRSVSTNAKSDIENFRFFKNLVRSRLKQKGFTNDHLSLLPQVKFWEVTLDINRESVKLLIAELLGVWVPDHALTDIVNSLVVDRVYRGSEKGTRLTKREFLEELEKRKKQIVEDSGYYSERENKERQIGGIIQGLRDPARKEWANNQLSALTNKPDLHYFTLKKLESKADLDLKDWKHLWRASATGALSFEVFKIFEQNVGTLNNRRYIVKFIPELIDKYAGFYAERFLETNVVRVCKKIIIHSRKHDSQVFGIVKRLFAAGFAKTFYVEHKRDKRWEREETGKLLAALYRRTGSKLLKQSIIDYVKQTFNLVMDEGEYWRYTPPSIFDILRLYVADSTERKVFELKKTFVTHYTEFYKKYSRRLKFNGWEHMGGGVSQCGNVFSVSDHHFVNKVLRPVLREYHRSTREKAWKLVLNHCVTRKQAEVSKTKPDFLNRAVIDVLLEEYIQERHRSEAFAILSDFIRMKRGIPHKSDLIFSTVRDFDMSTEDKWNLVAVSLDAYGNLPVNVFVEQVVLELAKHGHNKARDTLKAWVKCRDYHERSRVLGGNVAEIIHRFLVDSPKEGTELLRDFIQGDYFLYQMESFDVFAVARLLYRVLIMDFESGLEILQALSRKPELTNSEQILLWNALTAEVDSEKQDSGILVRIYRAFVDEFLTSMNNDVKKIEKKITRWQSREAIVQFANCLATHGSITEAVRIVKVFVHDSHPYTPRTMDMEDPEERYDWHKRIEQGQEPLEISTVRGWCAWTLGNCAVLGGRNCISAVIELTDKLCKDQNYYVKHMACFPLAQLVRNRLSVLPNRTGTFFLNDDRKKALEASKRIERITFGMLAEVSKLSINVRKILGKSILRALNHMRTLNESDARKLVQTLRKYPEDTIAEAAPLFIYFAEFRKNRLRNWKWKMPGLYDDLDSFDNKPFRKSLEDILRQGGSRIHAEFSRRFCELVEESVPGTPPIENVLGYDEAFTISHRYLDIILDYPNRRTFEHVYRLLADNLEKKPDEYFHLWMKCLDNEKQKIKAQLGEDKSIDPQEMPEAHWWPHETGEILLAIKRNLGPQAFLSSFESLLDYPKEARMGDIRGAVTALLHFPRTYDRQVGKIFRKLIDRDARYYDVMETWKEGTRNK